MAKEKSRAVPSVKAPVPRDIETALSPDWLAQALGEQWPGLKITEVTVVETLRTMATKTRFTLGFDGPAPPDAPTSLCLKGFFDLDEYQASAAPVSLVESLFYEQIAPKLAMEVPACLYAGRDAEARRGLIIMRDITAAGGKFLTALSPYSIAQAEQSLDQLARLHAQNEISGLAETGLITNKVAELARRPILPAAALQELLDGPRGVTLPPAIRDANRLHRGLAALAEFIAGTPQCLVHGDAHAGNIYEIDSHIGVIDWQVLQMGSWAQDVAYHISAALSQEMAEAQEWGLLDHYLECLASHGGARTDPDRAREMYRKAVVYGFYLWSITRRVEPAIVNVFVDRLGSAVTRHQSFEALGV